MDDHLDLVAWNAEQPMRLDHLESLVGERRRVDGDLLSHRPGRVGERLRDSDLLELLTTPTSERASGRRQDERLDRLG